MSEQYEVLAVRYGTRPASAAEVFLNYHVYREPDRPLGMDYFWPAAACSRTRPRPASWTSCASCGRPAG